MNSTINVTAGLVVYYTFPKIFDADNDSFSVTVNLGPALTFIKYDSTNLKLTLSPKSADVATNPYPVSITLLDNNPQPKSMKYVINVFVFPILNFTTPTQQSNTSTFNPHSNRTSIPATANNQGSIRFASLSLSGATRDAQVTLNIACNSIIAAKLISEQITEKNLRLVLLKTNEKLGFTIQSA